MKWRRRRRLWLDMSFVHRSEPLRECEWESEREEGTRRGVYDRGKTWLPPPFIIQSCLYFLLFLALHLRDVAFHDTFFFFSFSFSISSSSSSLSKGCGAVDFFLSFFPLLLPRKAHWLRRRSLLSSEPYHHIIDAHHLFLKCNLFLLDFQRLTKEEERRRRKSLG